MYIKKNSISTVFYSTVFTVLFFLFSYNSANAATIQINSNSTTLSPGGITTLSVVINSEGVAINNAEAKILFPSDLLEVVSVSKAGSVFSLWVEEPAYSNVTGSITFNGGVPTPGFNGSNGIALSIVVKAKTAGQANIILSEAAVRANDGLGTDVLSSKRDRIITIVKKEETVVETPVSIPSTSALQITSPTHPSQEIWYKENNPLFRWKVPTGVDAIQTGIDNNTSGSPRVTFVPVISERSVSDLKDGIWYFKVRARSSGQWGPTSTYIARIDTTAPINNGVTFSYDNNKRVLNITSDILDETSGIDYYEIFINEVLVKKVPRSEFINGKYDLSFDNVGDNKVRLLATDRAGNSVEVSGNFRTEVASTAVASSVKQDSDSSKGLVVSVGSFNIPLIYFVTILLVTIGALFISAFRLGRHYSRFHNKLKMRSALSKGDHGKVLLLLKKRLEKHLQILQHTRHDRILSAEEKEIKEAIEGDLDEVDKAIEALDKE